MITPSDECIHRDVWCCYTNSNAKLYESVSRRRVKWPDTHENNFSSILCEIKAVIKNQARNQIGYGFSYLCSVLLKSDHSQSVLPSRNQQQKLFQSQIDFKLFKCVSDPCVRHFGNIEVQSSKDSLKKFCQKSALKFEHWSLSSPLLYACERGWPEDSTVHTSAIVMSGCWIDQQWWTTLCERQASNHIIQWISYSPVPKELKNLSALRNSGESTFQKIQCMTVNGNAIRTGPKRPLKQDVCISEVWNSRVQLQYVSHSGSGIFQEPKFWNQISTFSSGSHIPSDLWIHSNGQSTGSLACTCCEQCHMKI